MQGNFKSLVFSAISGIFVMASIHVLRAQEPSPHGTAPHLFAPRVISTSDYEFDTSFTPDGKTVYFSKGDPGFNRITIVESHFKNGDWTRPKVAPFSGQWKDTDAQVSPRGDKLFFISNRPINGADAPRNDYDIWYVERSASGGWGEPKHLQGPVNTDGNEAYPSVTADGTLYFEAARTGHPGTHIYRSRLHDGQYGEPELLSFSAQANDLNPTVASDGSFMVFVSRDRGGLGAGDLYISFQEQDGTWGAPTNLGSSINSRFHEIAPGLSPDNRRLYFASNRVDGPTTRTARIDYRQLEDELHAIQNGLLNIYEVDLGDVHRFQTH